MGCWKVMDLRLRVWLPWTVMLVAALLTCGYYEVLNPGNCADLFFGCTINSFAPRLTRNDSSEYHTRNQTRSYGPPSPPPPPPPFKPLYNDTRRIAICLVGGARMFELTGRTIKRHLLEAFPNGDVFLHSPLDKDSHKFSLIAGTRNLRMARIFTPTPIQESRITNEVITSWGSPHGMQGLLQYFNLVEGCYGMVKQYEVRNKFKYDWIIRTRVDGYWSGPMPNITGLDPTKYYIAAGSDFNGFNDRFGMGNAHTSRAANSRLSLLPLLHQRGLRGLNSESAYKAQLDFSGVGVARIKVPFCVMTLRREQYPPPRYGLLMLSMASSGPMSGTYCRPCDKEMNVTTSKWVVDQCALNWDWPGVPGNEVTVCDGSKPWASNWREIAEEIYKEDSGDQEGIWQFENRSLKECVREMRAFQVGWDVWNSPPVETICKAALSK